MAGGGLFMASNRSDFIVLSASDNFGVMSI